jgi:hypothetical protein
VRITSAQQCRETPIEAAAASAAQAGRQQQVAATGSNRQMPANTNDMLYEKREFPYVYWICRACFVPAYAAHIGRPFLPAALDITAIVPRASIVEKMGNDQSHEIYYRE